MSCPRLYTLGGFDLKKYIESVYQSTMWNSLRLVSWNLILQTNKKEKCLSTHEQIFYRIFIWVLITCH
jgi:hypothetical protein